MTFVTIVVLVLVLAVPALLVLVLGVLTGVGSRHRGARWSLAMVSGLFFPVTWVAWYVRDQRPFTHHRVGGTTAQYN